MEEKPYSAHLNADLVSWLMVQAIGESVRKVKSGKGRFFDHQTVADWLSGWGQDNETERPR